MRIRNLLMALAALGLSATLVQPAMAASTHKPHAHHAAHKTKKHKKAPKKHHSKKHHSKSKKAM